MRNSLLTGLLAAGATLILAGPAAAQDLIVKTSGLDFGRDITLRPGDAPVQMDVRAGETFTVTASASQPDRPTTVSLAVGNTTWCGNTISQPLVAPKTATAGPGQTATVAWDVAVGRGCSVNFTTSARIVGGASAPTATFSYRYATTPFGSLDLAEGRDAAIRVAGWTIDPETAAPLDVHAYVDGQFAGAATANVLRPDVGAAFPPYGPNHGYDFNVRARPGARTVCTYAINAYDGDVNPQIACRAVQVRMPPACSPIQAEIEETQAEIAGLQAELRYASTGEKSALTMQIRALNAHVASLRTQLDRCLGF